MQFYQNRFLEIPWNNIAFGIPIWGGMGVTIDFFYRCQAVWFGEGTDPATLAIKAAGDQFLFTPLNCSVVLALFLWRSEKFGKSALPRIFSADFLTERLFPMLAAAWCVWIPGVLVVYCMPSALQLPVGALIYTFWILIFTFLHKEGEKE